MTFYKIIFENGGHAFIDSHVLENETRRKHPLGFLHWVQHEVHREWKEIEKVS